MRITATFILPLLSIVLNINTAAGQQAYSESLTYEARVFHDAKKKRKGKKPQPPALPIGELVVPVAVQDRSGNFITNLSKSDVTVFLDNTPLEITGIDSAKDTPTTLVLLFDTSASLESQLKSTSEMATELINGFGPGDRAMVAAFNEKLKVRQPFTSDKTLLAKSLKGMSFGSGTSIYDAVSKLVTEGLASEPGRTYVVVFTDGVDTTSSRADFESSLIEAERGNITFIPVYLDTFPAILAASRTRPMIGFPPLPISRSNMAGMAAAEYQRGRDYLNDLSVATGGRPYMFSNDPIEQGKIRTHILAGIRSTWFVRVKRPPSSAEVRRHPLRVRVAKPDVRVFATGSYLTGY